MVCLPDHPRVSGEHHQPVLTTATFGGSSPRERGALSVSKRTRFEVRIIPA